MIKTISYADFEKARQMWGEPKHLPPYASYIRAAYQIWAQCGQDFDILMIVYPEGGHCRIPIPTKELPLLCEHRPNHLQKLLADSPEAL